MRSNRSTVPLAAGLLAAALLVAGCGADEPGDEHPSGAGPVVGHIHGLGVDPADGDLYVASHAGVFRVDGSGDAHRVADRWQDTMAFTVVGPRHFLASGHPDLREDLPPHLGLIESKDAGETWQPLALQGKADFHLLEQIADTLYAYDATSGRLLATTNRGSLVAIDAASSATTQLGGPTLVLLETTAGGEVVGIAPDGGVQVSEDAGRIWTPRGDLGGQPAAFTITDQGWFAATVDQVFRSGDDGATWTRVVLASRRGEVPSDGSTLPVAQVGRPDQQGGDRGPDARGVPDDLPPLVAGQVDGAHGGFLLVGACPAHLGVAGRQQGLGSWERRTLALRRRGQRPCAAGTRGGRLAVWTRRR